MMSRFLVFVVLVNPFALSDAHASKFDRLTRGMANFSKELAMAMVPDSNTVKSLRQRRNYVFVGRPRPLIRKSGNPSNDFKSQTWGPFAVGAAGAVGLGVLGYQTHQTMKQNDKATNEEIITMMEMAESINGLPGSSANISLPHLYRPASKDVQSVDNTLSRAASELISATERDLSHDEEALKRLLQNIRELKDLYYSREKTAHELHHFVYQLFYDLQQSDQFLENLKAANALESESWMFADLDLDSSIFAQNLSISPRP